MKRLLSLTLLGSAAILSTVAYAQTPPPAAGQVNLCEELARFVEQRGNAQPASPVTPDQARGFQRENNVVACRDGWVRIQGTGITVPAAVVAAVQAPDGQRAADGSNIVVQQTAPTVRLEQASPQVRVQQAQPQVTVNQGQPEIIVRQPQPTVTVDIPQPEIIVRMPQPDVNVAMAQPQVQVSQPEPRVQVVQPTQPPQVQVERAEPQVQVSQQPQQAGDQSNVEVQQAQGQPNVRYERAEPRVVVNQPQGQPQVRIEQQGEGEQAANAQSPQTQQQAAVSAPETTGAIPGAQALPVSRVTAMDLYNARGNELGDVERVVQGQDGKQFIVIGGVGGFLGIGERRVAIPVERVTMQGDRLVIQGMTDDQIKAMPQFDSNNRSFRQLEANQEVQINPVR